jgi:membrane protein DedA with SNARE-associated domain
MIEFLQPVIDWYMANLNYFTVALLMVIESSFIPFPSEVVIPFAAYKAAQGDMNVFGVILAGTVGALIGALINYYLAKYLGRFIVYKFADSKMGRILLLSKEKVVHAENYFIKHGRSSTFIGRLVPAVRQLISIPAGLAGMNMRDFIIYTTAGAGIWNIILAVIGYYLYGVKDKIFPYVDDILYVLGAVFVVYLVVKGIIQKRKGNKEKGARQEAKEPSE